MNFMNEWDIEDALREYRDHPVLGPAAQTLDNLRNWTNQNSDGWAYWPKPVRAAAKLIALFDLADSRRYRYHPDSEEITVAEYRAALRPIKAFRTRQGADFEIVEAD